MRIKGVNIQSEADYYKILSVTRNNENITAKEINALNSFLKGKETKEESINSLSEHISVVKEDKEFSAIRALAYRESYSFFEIEYKYNR